MRDPRHTSKEINRLRFAMMQSREKAGKSQNDMAKILGVHKNTVSNWENGYSVPDYLDVINWFAALKQPIDNEHIIRPNINDGKDDYQSEESDWLVENSEKWITVDKNLIERISYFYLRILKWKERKDNEKQEA